MNGRITDPTTDEEPRNSVDQEKTQINGKGIRSGQHLAKQIKRPGNGSKNEQQSINEHTKSPSQNLKYEGHGNGNCDNAHQRRRDPGEKDRDQSKESSENLNQIYKIKNEINEKVKSPRYSRTKTAKPGEYGIHFFTS